MARVKTAVLISGRGSNLGALTDAAEAESYPAEISLVISNRPEAPGLLAAAHRGIATRVIDHRDYGPPNAPASRAAFDANVTGALEETGVELVCLAGFMRILSDGFVAHWRDRLINIHPSLLPIFPGLDTHARALAAGVKLHGCTVHFVRETLDAGPIIGQAAVPVLDGDDPATLAARVLAAEHRLYPTCLRLVAGGHAGVVDEKVVFEGADSADSTAALLSPSDG